MEMRKLDSITFIGASWAGKSGTTAGGGNSMTQSCEQKGAHMGGHMCHTPCLTPQYPRKV